VFIQLQSFGYGVGLLALGLAAAALMTIASVSLRDTTPGWFSVFGYVAAVAMFASIIFFPIALFPLWVLIAGILQLRQPAAA
jgi:hypothetical protein